jgi:hypothetical protein
MKNTRSKTMQPSFERVSAANAFISDLKDFKEEKEAEIHYR